MTSNQLTYWRTEEDKRANLAREAENERHNRSVEGISSRTQLEDVRHNRQVEAETARHNLVTEEIDQIRQELAAKNIELDRAANLAKIQELYGKYGSMALNQMPNSMQAELASALGITSESFNDADFDSTLSSVWEEIKSIWSTFWGGISKLF